MAIAGLDRYQKRGKRHIFEDLPYAQRAAAEEWLRRLMAKGRLERGRVLPWLRSIYVEQAKRLVSTDLHAWGKRMLAKRGGYAVQRLYRKQGRTGPRHPAQKATRVRLARQQRQRDSSNGRPAAAPAPVPAFDDGRREFRVPSTRPGAMAQTVRVGYGSGGFRRFAFGRRTNPARCDVTDFSATSSLAPGFCNRNRCAGWAAMIALFQQHMKAEAGRGSPHDDGHDDRRGPTTARLIQELWVSRV